MEVTKTVDEAKLAGAPKEPAAPVVAPVADIDDDALDMDSVPEKTKVVKKLLRSAVPENAVPGVFAYEDPRGGYSYQNWKGERCYTTGELKA